MIGAGLHAGGPSNSLDKLIDIVSNGKAATELKKLQAETKKLQAAKKEILEGKTLTAFKKRVEADLDAKKTQTEESINNKIAEEKKASAEAKRTKTNADKALKALKEKEQELNLREQVLLDIEEEVEASVQELEEQETLLQKKLEHAEALQLEYTNKLNDIKERLKGL